MADRRAGVATAATGAGLIAGGGHLRERAIRQAHTALRRPRRLSLPGRSVLYARGLPGGRARVVTYAAGSGLGLIGAPALGVGTYQTLRKSDEHRNLAVQGLTGTREAVRAKAEGLRQDVSPAARAAGLGASAASGALGSLAAHRIVDRIAPATRFRPGITALAGTAATIGSIPLASRATRLAAPGYEVTPTGVRRRKTPPVRPTRRAAVVETRTGRGATRNARSQIVPTDTRVGKDVTYSSRTQRKGLRRHQVVDAHENGRNIGYASRRSGWIDEVYVRPESRGTGIGRELLRQSVDRSRRMRLRAAPYEKDVEVTGPDRPELMRMYRREGFRPKRLARAGFRAGVRTGYMERSVRKLDTNYPYAGLTPRQKRARVYAAGAIPGPLGPINAARQAARMAPPDQRRSAAALQYGGATGGAVAGGTAGAYGAAALARRSPYMRERMSTAQQAISEARSNAAHRAAGSLPGQAGRVAAQHVAESSYAMKPSLSARMIGTAEAHGGTFGRAVGRAAKPLAGAGGPALLGGWGGKVVGGLAGGYTGYGAALSRERKRNKKINSVAKAMANDLPLTPRQQAEQLHRKQRNLGWSKLNTTTGVLGTGLYVGSLATKHKTWKPRLETAALGTAITGGGISAVSSGKNIRTTRRDLRDQEARFRRQGVIKALRAPGFRRGATYLRRSRMPGVFVPVRRTGGVSKIDTTLSHRDVKRLTGQYGTRGPLPKELGREDRMQAYEARYIAAGGPKGERWKHRATAADRVTGGALAVGGTAAAAELAGRTKRGQQILQRARLHPARTAGLGGKIGLGAAATGAASELFHRHAERRQASYGASPAGVAASALQRMRAYTPQED